MKVLPTQQFEEKKYKLLGLIDERWIKTMGDMTRNFIGITYGRSGNGKTEYCMQMAMMLTHFDKAAWLSYEQGHSRTLQQAVLRNKMYQGKHSISWIDPKHKRNTSETLFQSLDNYLGKRSTPQFVFIDSLDYLRMTLPEYYYLEEKYGETKGIVFTSHADRATGKHPATAVGDKIEYDGSFGILVKDFIATPIKNRFSAFEPYVIYEQEARRRNPLFFEQRELANNTVKPQRKRKKAK